MSFVELPSFKGSRKRKKKMRGTRYCGRGLKGEKSRAGSKLNRGFEGGQMPLIRRIPKRGFSNARFKKEFEIINLNVLEKKFPENSLVTVETLKEKGLVKGKKPVKLLGNGEIKKPLKVKLKHISKTAREKIKNCGGTVEGE